MNPRISFEIIRLAGGRLQPDSANSPYYNKSAWRKAGDSNPEDAINAYTLSRRAPSPIRTALREALSVSLLILYQKIGAIVKKKIRGRVFFIDPTPFIIEEGVL